MSTIIKNKEKTEKIKKMEKITMKCYFYILFASGISLVAFFRLGDLYNSFLELIVKFSSQEILLSSLEFGKKLSTTIIVYLVYFFCLGIVFFYLWSKAFQSFKALRRIKKEEFDEAV